MKRIFHNLLLIAALPLLFIASGCEQEEESKKALIFLKPEVNLDYTYVNDDDVYAVLTMVTNPETSYAGGVDEGVKFNYAWEIGTYISSSSVYGTMHASAETGLVNEASHVTYFSLNSLEFFTAAYNTLPDGAQIIIHVKTRITVSHDGISNVYNYFDELVVNRN